MRFFCNSVNSFGSETLTQRHHTSVISKTLRFLTTANIKWSVWWVTRWWRRRANCVVFIDQICSRVWIWRSLDEFLRLVRITNNGGRSSTKDENCPRHVMSKSTRVRSHHRRKCQTKHLRIYLPWKTMKSSKPRTFRDAKHYYTETLHSFTKSRSELVSGWNYVTLMYQDVLWNFSHF